MPDDVATPKRMTDAETLWVIFDDLPGPESCQFVELENDKQEGRGPDSGITWHERPSIQFPGAKFYGLGPFVAKRDHDAELRAVEAQLAEARRALEAIAGDSPIDPNGTLPNPDDGYEDFYRDLAMRYETTARATLAKLDAADRSG